MYRQSYQRGMLTIFYSVGSKPLALWDTVTRDGYVTRFLDDDIKSMVLEIGGTNVSTTYMICPKGNVVLGITMPFLVMVVKNLRKYFSFEVTILDATGTRRRFRVSNFQSTTQILPLCTVMPIGLSEGWNQIQFNLAEITRRAYKKQFVEVQKVKINANIRLRRVYFAERLVPDEQLPAEYKLFFPIKQKTANGKDKKALTDLKPKQSLHQQSQPKQPQLEQSQVREPQQQQSKVQEPLQQQSQSKQLLQRQSQQVRKQQFENINDGDDDPDKIPEIKKDKSKYIGSVQVLKTVSHLQDLDTLDDRGSQVLEVGEGSLDQTNVVTGDLEGLTIDEEPNLELTAGRLELFEENVPETPIETEMNMESAATEYNITEEGEEERAVTEPIDEIEAN